MENDYLKINNNWSMNSYKDTLDIHNKLGINSASQNSYALPPTPITDVKKKIIEKNTLINIDSRMRQREIQKNDFITKLPNNPLTFTQNSNKININSPNHGLKENTGIILNNVKNIINLDNVSMKGLVGQIGNAEIVILDKYKLIFESINHGLNTGDLLQFKNISGTELNNYSSIYPFYITVRDINTFEIEIDNFYPQANNNLLITYNKVNNNTEYNITNLIKSTVLQKYIKITTISPHNLILNSFVKFNNLDTTPNINNTLFRIVKIPDNLTFYIESDILTIQEIINGIWYSNVLQITTETNHNLENYDIIHFSTIDIGLKNELNQHFIIENKDYIFQDNSNLTIFPELSPINISLNQSLNKLAVKYNRNSITELNKLNDMYLTGLNYKYTIDSFFEIIDNNLYISSQYFPLNNIIENVEIKLLDNSINYYPYSTLNVLEYKIDNMYAIFNGNTLEEVRLVINNHKIQDNFIINVSANQVYPDISGIYSTTIINNSELRLNGDFTNKYFENNEIAIINLLDLGYIQSNYIHFNISGTNIIPEDTLTFINDKNINLVNIEPNYELLKFTNDYYIKIQDYYNLSYFKTESKYINVNINKINNINYNYFNDNYTISPGFQINSTTFTYLLSNNSKDFTSINNLTKNIKFELIFSERNSFLNTIFPINKSLTEVNQNDVIYYLDNFTFLTFQEDIILDSSKATVNYFSNIKDELMENRSFIVYKNGINTTKFRILLTLDEFNYSIPNLIYYSSPFEYYCYFNNFEHPRIGNINISQDLNGKTFIINKIVNLDNYIITMTNNSLYDLIFGGNFVYILISQYNYNNYLNPNNYTIKLPKIFKNIKSMRFIEGDFNYNYITIDNNNNLFIFYLNAIEYIINIPNGIYTIDNLLNQLMKLINKQLRKYEMVISRENNKITFAIYNIYYINNPFILIDNILYLNNNNYILPENLNEFEIIIEKSNVLNGKYIINKNTLEFIDINNINYTNNIAFGGELVKILIPKTKEILQLDFISGIKNKTLGYQLGFNNILYGSIDNYNYYYTGNELINEGYAIIKCETLDAYTTDNIIAKVHLNNKYSTNREYNILTSITKNFDGFPIDNINELKFKFEDYKGNLINLGYLEHNFSLEIIENIEHINDTKLNSKYINLF